MNHNWCRSQLLFVAGSVVSVLTGASSAEELYRVTDLGTLGGQYSSARALNASGQVTGFSLTGDERDGFVPFLWSGGTMRRLGTEADTFDFGFGSGVAINNAGQVAGNFEDETGDESFAFRSVGTTIQDLGTLGGFRVAAQAINASGQVAGFSTKANFQRRAFFWNGSTMKDLGTLGGTESAATDINNAGQVTGFATTAGSLTHAFLWNGTTLKDLGTLGGTYSSGSAINSSGHVVGKSLLASSPFEHAFLWNGAKMIDLGTLGGDTSFAVAINTAGQVTGSAAVASQRMHAFLLDGGTMLDLGVLSGTDSNAFAINDLGQVTGTYVPAGDGQFHAFIWNGTAMRDLNARVDPSDPLKPFVKLHSGLDINKRGQIAASGRDSRKPDDHGYLVTPLEFRITFIEPATKSNGRLGEVLPVKISLTKESGERISDARAASLAATPCKVKFSASGAQSRTAVCMKYDAIANVFYFNWALGTSGTGSTDLKVAATYKFSMPEIITTTKSRTVSIIQ
jgi:probable HAF family extracellular repeat protein